LCHSDTGAGQGARTLSRIPGRMSLKRSVETLGRGHASLTNELMKYL